LPGGIPAQRAGPEASDLRRQLGGGKGELPCHGRGQVDHLEALPLQADPFQQLSGLLHSAAGVDITFQVMTVTLQSTRDESGVDSFFEGSQQMQSVHPAGARHFDDLDRGRILEAQAPG
jgi:hypothetical protein